jgi:hypothetical protein
MRVIDHHAGWRAPHIAQRIGKKYLAVETLERGIALEEYHPRATKHGSATNDEVRIGTFYLCDRVVEFTGTGGRRTMQPFLDRYAQEIAGVLSGFDRLYSAVYYGACTMGGGITT